MFRLPRADRFARRSAPDCRDPGSRHRGLRVHCLRSQRTRAFRLPIVSTSSCPHREHWKLISRAPTRGMEDSQRAPKRPQSQILRHGELFRSRVPAGSARGEGSRSYRTAGVLHPGRIVPHPPRGKRRVATRLEAARRQTGWLPPLSRISCTLLVSAGGGSSPETAPPDSRNQKRSCRKPHLRPHFGRMERDGAANGGPELNITRNATRNIRRPR
jgi:hypothetical protein